MDRFLRKCKISSKLATRQLRRAFAKYGAQKSAVPLSVANKNKTAGIEGHQKQLPHNSAVYWFWVYMMRHNHEMPKKFTHPRPVLMP